MRDERKIHFRDRISDLCEMENHVTTEQAIAVLVSEVELIQTLQEVIKDMNNCIGASGGFMDKKLEKWINKLK